MDLHFNEDKRLEALYSLKLLDTEGEKVYDNITKLVAQTLDVPVAYISLVDKDRQWFKSKIGMEIAETPRKVALCNLVTKQRKTLVINDTFKDVKDENVQILIKEHQIQAYIGVPIFVDQQAIGTLCAVDNKIKNFTESDIQKIETLAEILTDELIKRKKLHEWIEQQYEHVQLKSIMEIIFHQSDYGFIIYRFNEPQKIDNLDLTFHTAILESNLFKMNKMFEQFSSQFNLCGETLQRILDFIGIKTSQLLKQFTNETSLKLVIEKELNNRIHWYEIQISLIIDNNKNGIGLFIAQQNVTEEKEQQAILQEKIEENKILMSALNQAEFGLIVTDPTKDDNPIIYASDGFSVMTGYSNGEVLGKNCRFLQGDQTKAETVKKLRGAVNNRERTETEILNYRKNGEPFWNQLIIDPVFDEHGKLTHFIGVQRDVTERKKIANLLHEQEQRYYSLFTHNQDAVYLLDLEGNLSEINEACEKLMGFLKEELTGMHFSQLIVDEDLPGTVRFFTEIIAQKQPNSHITTIQRKDGSRRVIEIRAVPLIVEGTIIGVYGISKDITVVKEAEKQLKLSSKLFETMHEFALIIDKNFKILSVNPSLEAVSKLKRKN